MIARKPTLTKGGDRGTRDILGFAKGLRVSG